MVGKIRTGPQAAKACEDINARAFTVGNHVAFNRGEYDPSSAEGQHVLAHELAHVRQQTGGAVSMLPQEGELQIDPDEQLEREAEETAERVMRGGEIGVHRMRKSDVHIQRMAGSTDRNETFTPTDVAVESTDEPEGPEYREVNQNDDVATQVAVLAENQQTLRSQVEGLTQSAAEKMGVEAGKGTIAATGGLVGTALMPGLGTLVGGAVGGLAGAVYERNFDAGAEAMSDMSGDLLSAIDDRIRDIVERFVGSEHGGDSTGDVEMGQVKE